MFTIFEFLISDEMALGAVRCVPGLFMARSANAILLKINALDDSLPSELLSLPTINSYQVDEAGYMFPIGKLTPVGIIPDMDWRPISELLPVELPLAILPGINIRKCSIKLVRSTEAREGVGLLTNLSLLKRFVGTTNKIRFEHLEFAVEDKGRTLVLGSPVPSIPGKEYWADDHILLPTGYDFEYPVTRKLLKQKYDKGNCVLINNDSTIEIINRMKFKTVSRRGVKTSG